MYILFCLYIYIYMSTVERGLFLRRSGENRYGSILNECPLAKRTQGCDRFS